MHVFEGPREVVEDAADERDREGDWGVCPATPEDLESRWTETGAAYWDGLRASGRPVFAFPT